MEKKSNKKLGGVLLGLGSISAFFGLFCCGLPWVFASLFAMLGLSFILNDSILISIIILGIIVALIGWRMLKK
jgi:hypothetical protein